MSICSEFAAQEAANQILINQTLICANVTNILAVECGPLQGIGGDLGVLCSSLCAAGLQSEFNWTSCTEPPPG